MSKLVSIIIPCYKQAQFLDECLNSVYLQTYHDWECIIVNDGSPDNTNEVANNWLTRDDRFKYVEKQNGGLSSARNTGLKLAKGEYVQFLDSDDLIDREKLEIQVHNLEKNNLDIDISDFIMYDIPQQRFNNQYLSPFFSGKTTYIDEIILNWENKISIPPHCIIFKKTLIKSDLYFFEESLYNHEDWVFWVKLFYNTCKIGQTKLSLAIYRRHNNNMSSDSLSMKKGFLFAAVQLEYFFNLNNQHRLKNLVKRKLELIKNETQRDIFGLKFINKALSKIGYKIIKRK